MAEAENQGAVQPTFVSCLVAVINIVMYKWFLQTM